MFQSLSNLIHVLRRYKVAAVLNLFGLAVAFTTFILLMMYARHEYSFDGFHPNGERIFQLENKRTDGIWETNFSRPHLERIFTSSAHIVQGAIYRGGAYSQVAHIAVSTAKDAEEAGTVELFEWITPAYAEVFSFEMLEGSSDALQEPGKILIPETAARRLYGDEPAVGKSLYIAELQGFGEKVELSSSIVVSVSNTVGGVYRDFPENSRVANAIYCSIRPEEMMDDWWTGCYYAYLLLDSPESAQEVIADYMEENKDLLRRLAITDIRLRPLDELYFGEHVRSDASPAGDKTVTDMLLIVAFLIIAISSVNFVNFAVALAPARIKNINTRKVLGCSTAVLRRNLVLESVFVSVLAFALSLLFLWMIEESGWLEGLLGGALTFNSNGVVFWGTGVISLLTGVLAGIYPAWYMTSFPPVLALNGSFALTGHTRFIRRFLTGFQYTVSLLLIICSSFIFLQHRYLNQVSLGFDKENILEVKLPVSTAYTKYDLYRQKLREHPGIKDVAFSDIQFAQDESKPIIGYFFEGEHHYQYWVRVSWNFPQVMGLGLLEGRYFREGDGERSSAATVCMISRADAKEMGSSIGGIFQDNGSPVEIIGIFEDARFESLYQPVKPLGLWVASATYDRNTIALYTYVRLASGNPQDAIDHIYRSVKEIDPTYPLTIRFMDERLDDLYAKSRNQGLMVTLFCLIAMLLSIIGVFGLVIFETQGKTKEIAVRKVMGGTAGELIRMFNAGYIKLVAVCFVIAVPAAVFLMNAWLEGFTERTPLQVWVFLAVFLVVLLITVLTVTFQSYRAATANPAKSLQKG